MNTATVEKHNTVRITILDKTYTLRATMSPEHMQRVAAFVDEKVRQLRQDFPDMPIQRLAVLAAIQIADEHLTTVPINQDNSAEIRQRINSLINHIDEILAKD